ncbi:MAG: ABC transporter substrate-binding protein [Armatimonadota bacterium]|nr:ABC transporter substrate-binding protein [Armatimonadota bacterium]MDR7426975.1 ABC transporter substrate-binding protein [Armatimonadota bacterium]MDR7463107.1 ABC transporter substrate-binding protein [Armatimonadota bacterium]MDR7469310.1 ABC transporter substrate-binding protein [Armatimonadota bacterium]MDR7475524.1 ABC transporter substrate-binding protein [Armatimonadota bacterium]
MRYRRLCVMSVLAALLAATLGGWAQAAPPVRGGTLTVALSADPPALDIHSTTAYLTEIVSWHVFEPLFTYDRNFRIIPMLAEGYTVGQGGREYTITLRSGVRFHNGKEMTAQDVVASLQRWMKLAVVAVPFFRDDVEAVEARGPRTVVVRLRQPSGILIAALAQPIQLAGIYPEAVVTAAGTNRITQLSELIGTGPFRFVRWQPGQVIELERFEGYAARPGGPDGYGGQKVAYVDRLRFVIVPDVQTRINGVLTGQYDYAESITADAYADLRNNPRVRTLILKPYGQPMAVFNKRKGLFTDRRMRQAFLAALDMSKIMAGTFGNPLMFRVDGSLMFRESPWYSRAGLGPYNARNVAEARRLLAEAGYRGQPVRWITSAAFDWAYKPALIASQQLAEAGFTIDLQVLDWATVLSRRANPDLYEVFSTSFIFSPGIDPPIQPVIISPTWPGWWTTEEKDRLIGRLIREPDIQARKQIWEQVQRLYWEDVPGIKFGDFFNLAIARPGVQGLSTRPDLFFWNVWVTP